MPLYAPGPRAQRVFQPLRDRILSGELQPGSRLPSQRDLSLHYGVSPMTVRLAVSELEDQGLVVRQPRRGTFVRAHGSSQSPRPLSDTVTPVACDLASAQRAAHAAHAAEIRYRALLDGAPFGISLADLQGNFLVANAAFQKLVGYSEQELLEMTYMDLTHPDDAEPDRTLFAAAVAGIHSEYEVEKRYIRKDGEIVSARLTVLVPRDAGGSPTYDIAIVQDITERKRAEQEIRRTARALAEQELERDVLINAIPSGVVVVDAAGKIVLMNETGKAILGAFPGTDVSLAEQAAAGHAWEPATGRAMKAGSDPISLALAGETVTNFEIAFRLESEETDRMIRVSAAPLLRVDGSTRGAVAVFTDVTEERLLADRLLASTEALRRSETRFRHLALHDDLTDLPNRTQMAEQAPEAIGRAQRDGRPLAILLLDLVRFGLINGTFGHAYGDLALEQIGKRLHRLVRKDDIVARVAGDEFAVLLNGAGEQDALQVAAVLHRGLDEPYVVGGHTLYIGTRIGIALYPEHGADVQELLRYADVAMRTAAQRGEVTRVFDPTQHENASESLSLLAGLRKAIGGDELLMHYQPKVDLRTRSVRDAEALVRWCHPTRGWISPSVFVELAEGSGLIGPLTIWVLNAVLAQCAEWKRSGSPVGVAVNLSARSSLHDSAIVDTIARTLQQWSVDPHLLTVEITETSFMLNPEAAMQAVTQLHDIGVRIAIDDFGTGYSSLAYLKRLPVDELKIDGSFIQSVCHDARDLAIVRSAIELAHNLGMQVVAEGVEDKPTWEVLAAAGCDFVQGYYVSRPLPADEFDRWRSEEHRGHRRPEVRSVHSMSSF